MCTAQPAETHGETTERWQHARRRRGMATIRRDLCCRVCRIFALSIGELLSKPVGPAIRLSQCRTPEICEPHTAKSVST